MQEEERRVWSGQVPGQLWRRTRRAEPAKGPWNGMKFHVAEFHTISRYKKNPTIRVLEMSVITKWTFWNA